MRRNGRRYSRAPQHLASEYWPHGRESFHILVIRWMQSNPALLCTHFRGLQNVLVVSNESTTINSAWGESRCSHPARGLFAACKCGKSDRLGPVPGDRAAQKPRPRAWQRMLSGRRLDLLDPSALDIEIEDIAHGLARVARWNGQTSGAHIFSVAQHCLLVEALARAKAPRLDRGRRLAVLLHDAPEYVIGDMISPFKAVIGASYKAVEARLLAAIFLRFGLPAVPPDDLVAQIKAADRSAAFLEATRLAGFSVVEARRFFGQPPKFSPVIERDYLTPWPGE